MNCYLSGILCFLLISLLWGRKIVAPPCLVIVKSGLERGPRREFFFSGRSSIEASGRRALDRGLGPPKPRWRAWALPLGPSFASPFPSFPFSLSLPSSGLLAFLPFLALPSLLPRWWWWWPPLPSHRALPHRALLTEPSSQSLPRRACLTEPLSQSPPQKSLPRKAFLTEPLSQGPPHRRAFLTEPSSQSLPHRASSQSLRGRWRWCWWSMVVVDCGGGWGGGRWWCSKMVVVVGWWWWSMVVVDDGGGGRWW